MGPEPEQPKPQQLYIDPKGWRYFPDPHALDGVPMPPPPKPVKRWKPRKRKSR